MSLYHKRNPEAPPTYGVPSMEVMAMQIQKLSADLQNMHASMRDRDEDQSYYSKQAYEKLSRMHQLITNKERQLMERIAAVQEHLGTVDQTGRENGERRIRLAEEKTEMVKQAFEKRAGMAEMGISRERRERIEAEERIRSDVRSKLENFAVTLRDNEALVKSAQTRLNQNLQQAQADHLKNLQSLKDNFQDALVSLANRIKALQTSHKEAESRAEEKTREATRQISDMLKAEIKVRKSALAKVAEALAQHETLVRHDIAQIAASVHAKQELHGCKLDEIEAAAASRHESFASDTEKQLSALQRDHQTLEESLRGHVVNLGTRIETLQTSLADKQKTFSNQVRELSVRMSCQVQSLRSDVFEKLGSLEDRMLQTLEERMSKLERLLSNEQLDRHQHCQNVKNEVVDQLTQLRNLHAEQDQEVRAELAQTRDHVLAIVDERTGTLQASLKSSTEQTRDHLERIAANAHEAVQEVHRSTYETLDAHASQHKALQERLDATHAELTAADDCVREEILALGKDADAKFQRTSNRLDGIYGDLQREIDRSTNKDLELAGAAAAARTELQNAISEASSRLESTMEAKLENERTHAASYTDNKVSAARAVLATSIETEAASRTAAIRGMHEDLVAAIASASEKVRVAAAEDLAAAKKALEVALRDDSAAHAEAEARLSTIIEASAHDLRSDVRETREEINVRAAVDALCAKVELESAAAQLEVLGDEVAPLRGALRAHEETFRGLVAAEAGARDRALEVLQSETRGALEALTASHCEEIAKVLAAQAAARTQAEHDSEDLRQELRGETAGKLAEVAQKIDELASTSAATNERLEKSFEDGLGEIKEAVQAQETAVSGTIDELKAAVQAQEAAAEAAQETTSALGIQVDNLAAAMPDGKALSQRIESIYEELNSKKEEPTSDEETAALEALRKQLQDVEGQVAGLETWCTGASGFQSEIHARVNSLEEAILLVGNEGLKTASEVHALETGASNMQSAVENLEETVLLVGNEGLETANEVRDLRTGAAETQDVVENLEEAVLLVGNEGLAAHRDVAELETAVDDLAAQQPDGPRPG